LGDTLKDILLFYENQGKDSIKNVVFNVRIYRKGVEVFSQFQSRDIPGTFVDSLHFIADLELNEATNYTLRMTSSSLDDQNPFNDTLIETFPVEIKQDLSLFTFINPSKIDIPDSTTLWNPGVLIRNIGSMDSTAGSSLIYTVRSLTNNTVVFADTSAFGKIAANDSLKVGFAKFKTLLPDAYIIEAFIRNSVDKVPNNDTLRMPYVLEKNWVSERNNSNSIFISPNPANHWFRIDVPQSEWYQITLTDAHGRVILHRKERGSLVVLTEKYSSGMYLITVETREGVFSQKILIEH